MTRQDSGSQPATEPHGDQMADTVEHHHYLSAEDYPIRSVDASWKR